MRDEFRAIQSALKSLGYNPGPIDGVFGPRTEAALRQFLAQAGKPVVVDAVTDLPWMVEAKRLLGRHETRDKGWLSRWLRSDGRTLGDPEKLPCDFVETCIRLALPGEPLTGPLGENPYWARNWLRLGSEITPTYGAVVVFSRGSGGHVGFAVGQDEKCLFVLGGNQSNSVIVTPVPKANLLGARWPATFARPLSTHLPRMTRSGPIFDNQA